MSGTAPTGRSLGVICARAGSRGLPGKNVAPVAGKPLIVWSVEAARGSRLDRVIVSTDGEEIARVARAAGAEVPFLRDPELSRDDSPILAVLQDALARAESGGERYQTIVLLQATSPLRTAVHVDRALDLLAATGADSVVSVCPSKLTPHWMRTVDPEGRVRPLIESPLAEAPRQELPAVYALNGAVYATRRRVLVEERRLLGHDVRALVMAPEESVDVDLALDLALAELLLSRRR